MERLRGLRRSVREADATGCGGTGATWRRDGQAPGTSGGCLPAVPRRPPA
ncbi:hypothetical protein QWZ14_09235 [Paeniroseomonas aquatica]|uniref:Uncharacterized protein n=1 Tax=Paeniroseomonas aquatica TaxID=373043 RepID=A0ABT8A4E7_9PROT|nr:hypothetical protein [Paeniroseomonas aquatica]MDN3564545.1 hypothetical protein [Paeniroseomonas aquatica]